MNPNKLRLAVFDCDGTLVDSQHSIISSMAAACLAQGIAAPEPEQVRRIVGLTLDVGIGKLFPFLDSTGISSMREGYRQAFMDLRARGNVNEPLYPGIVEILTRLQSENWLLGVATGKSHKGLLNTLVTHDLEDRFLTLQTADRAAGKPHPEMIHNAISETGVEALATVMIGDTTFDIEMARNAGVWAIGVAWGYHEADELAAAGAHRVVHNSGDLSDAIFDLVPD